MQPLPLEIQQRIDDLSVEFERAWRDGDTPRLEEFLQRIPHDGRSALLSELWAIEAHYRETSDDEGARPEEIQNAHPGLAEELAELTSVYTPSTAKTGRTASGLLRIRCPDCRGDVQLPNDAALDRITCTSCRGHFSLIDHADTSRMAPTLQSLGRFELIARLGVGGFGTVWKARDTELDRIVAVKMPRRGELGAEEVEYFFREARAAAQLRHPNIVPVFEVGRHDDTVFIISDFIRGVTLTDWLTGQRPNAREAAEICVKISDALHHAHEQGVIHRDVKPSNVMMDRQGQPHLTDFGLAKREVGEITMTVDGRILGSPAYMSPEQAQGKGHQSDQRSDIYSLGVVLFRLLTSELPFRGNAQMQIHKRLTEDPPDPRWLCRHIPKDLATICEKCLQRDPGRRYQTAEAVSDELRRFLQGRPIQARPLSGIQRAWRWANRNRALAAALALTVLAAIFGPTAAVVIESQRQKLAQRLVENRKLIVQKENAKQALEKELLKANERLDAIYGGDRALVESITPWRMHVIQEAMQQHLDPLARHAAETSDPFAAAQLHLGIGMLLEQTARHEEAIEHFEAARRYLQGLVRENPQSLRCRAALASTCVQLSKLYVQVGNSEQVGDLVREAVAHHRALADHEPADAERQGDQALRHRVDYLASILATIESWPAPDRLDARRDADRVAFEIVSQWPTDPGELYWLACALTFHDPLLLDWEMPNRKEAEGERDQKDVRDQRDEKDQKDETPDRATAHVP